VQAGARARARTVVTLSVGGAGAQIFFNAKNFTLSVRPLPVSALRGCPYLEPCQPWHCAEGPQLIMHVLRADH